MSFEYKVGYLWKYHEEDPDHQSWNWENLTEPLGRKVQSARADWLTFACRQCFASGSQLWYHFFLLGRVKLCGSRNSQSLLLFLSFSSSSLSLSSLLLFFNFLLAGFLVLGVFECPDRESQSWKFGKTTDREFLEKDSVCKLLTSNVWLDDYYLIWLS